MEDGHLLKVNSTLRDTLNNARKIRSGVEPHQQKSEKRNALKDYVPGGSGAASAILVRVTEITPAGVAVADYTTGEAVGFVVFPDMLMGTTGTMEIGQTLVVYPILHEGTILKTTIPGA